MTTILRNRPFFLLLSLLVFFCISCEDDRSGTVTGPQNTLTSNGITVSIQASNTTLGVGSTFDLTLTATCNGCSFVGEDSWPFSYTTLSSRTTPASDAGSYSLDDGESESGIFITFQGLKASSPGIQVLRGTFNGSITVSIEVTIE